MSSGSAKNAAEINAVRVTSGAREPDIETIRLFAGRSDRLVTGLATMFAVGGAVMEIASHTIGMVSGHGGGFAMLWGMWIPLCFMTIPPIHYLCRHVRRLEQRIAQLEAARPITENS